VHFGGLTSCYRLHDGGKQSLVGAQLAYGWKQYDEVSGDVPKESESYGGECESRKFLTAQYFTDLAFEVRRLPGSRPAPSARDEIDAPEATPSREESSP